MLKLVNGKMEQHVPCDSLPLSSSLSRAVWPSPSADAAWSRSSQLALLVMLDDPLAFQAGLFWLPCLAYTWRIQTPRLAASNACC